MLKSAAWMHIMPPSKGFVAPRWVRAWWGHQLPNRDFLRPPCAVFAALVPGQPHLHCACSWALSISCCSGLLVHNLQLAPLASCAYGQTFPTHCCPSIVKHFLFRSWGQKGCVQSHFEKSLSAWCNRNVLRKRGFQSQEEKVSKTQL